MKAVINTVISWFLKKRLEQVQNFIEHPHQTQHDLLEHLIGHASNTQIGQKFDFKSIRNYEDFKKRLPIHTYEEFYPYIDQIFKGETNVTWPSRIEWFAKSSGTTSDRSKFIPVSYESLENCHFKAGKDLYALYYAMNPNAQIFTGKSLVLGGSHEINELNNSTYYGDISAVLMQNLPFWAAIKRKPNLDTALMKDWEAKIEAIARQTKDDNITNILGVPTWTVVLIEKLFEITGKDNLAEIWPELELYIHGGVSFKPYQELFKNLIRKPDMHYLETYNASEGFFGIQDQLNANEMLLMLDYGIFYEFLPVDEDDNPSDEKAIDLSQVEKDKNYAMVITTNAGLWRYKIGDTIRFTSCNPYRIKVTGRTKSFINAFGEEVIVENAEHAITEACNTTNAIVNDYTAGPLYFDGTNRAGHEWLIEFEEEPEDFTRFQEVLDQMLQKLNSDYEAKRYKSLALKAPVIHKLEKGTFYQWMKAKGKLGGQNKVPRLFNSRDYLDDILDFIGKSGSIKDT